MKIKKWLTLCVLIVGMLLCSACAFDFKFNADEPGRLIHFAVHTKYGVGQVEKQGETQTVEVGEKATLRAIDTEEYTFSHWEFLNQIISNEREYVLKPTESDINFRNYYAVFVPKDTNKVLVNVLCEKGETIDMFPYIAEERLQVSGGGYYSIGETVTLESMKSGVGIVRKFTYGGITIDGPTLTFSTEKNITVTATLEKMITIATAENEHCTITLQGDDVWFKETDLYRVAMEMKTDEYVPDVWQIKDAVTNEILGEWNWEENTTFENTVSYSVCSLHNRLLIDLVCTNENLMDTPLVEIRSTTGDAVGIEVEKPEKMIRGRGFPMWVTLDEYTYIQDIYKTAAATEEFPFASVMYFRSVQDIYETGGEVYVPDASDAFGDGYRVVMEAIPKTKAAIVNVISDDEFIDRECKETGKKPSSWYAPTLNSFFLIVEKGKEQNFQLLHHENLNAIYEVGYQFSAVENEDGEKISDTIEFLFTVEEDTNYYMKWEKKPVFDLYFDYTLTPDRTGYVAKLSPLTLFGQVCPVLEEIALPYLYNGKPVKGIADYGMSAYRCYPAKCDLKYYSSVPFKKIILPYTLETIGEKAFAGCFDLQVVLPQGDSLSQISPDAFFSPNDAVCVNLTEKHLGIILQTLHTRYIGENEDFTYQVREDSHFDAEATLAHYESLAEYICIKKNAFSGGISAFELNLFYHEFFHHYQVVAMVGVGEETLETMRIKPADEEVDAWKLPYDKTDYESYWNHPLEASAREFATLWSGLVLNNG